METWERAGKVGCHSGLQSVKVTERCRYSDPKAIRVAYWCVAKLVPGKAVGKLDAFIGAKSLK
jgi:hypothetical protein